MAGMEPLLGDAEIAKRLGALLRLKISGSGGISVSASPDGSAFTIGFGGRPGKGAGDGGSGGLQAVYLRQVGGTNGDDGSTTTAAFPTFTYDVFTDAAKTNRIGTACAVVMHRPLKVAVTVAAHGLARVVDGVCELWFVDEYFDRTSCP